MLWDWPGHLERASIAVFPWQGGWDTAFWGGYPTATYPNFYHLLLKGAILLSGGNEKIGAKIRDAQMQKIPYMLVVGEKELASESVSIRHRDKGDLGVKPLSDFLFDLKPEISYNIPGG